MNEGHYNTRAQEGDQDLKGGFTQIEESTQTSIREERLDTTESNDYQQVSQRSNGNDEMDMDSQVLFHETLFHNYHQDSLIVKASKLLLVILKKIAYYSIMTLYHFLTTFYFVMALIIFVSGSMIIIIAKLILQKIIPERNFPLFQDNEIQVQIELQRRRRLALEEQLSNQRIRNLTRSSNRRVNTLEDTVDSLPSISSGQPSPLHTNFDFAEETQEESLNQRGQNNMIENRYPVPISIDRALSSDIERSIRRRESIRNEIIRILNMRNLARRSQNSLNRQLFVQDLQFLRGLHNRDFTSEDYEILSSLDNMNFRNPNHHISSLIISQLPTYLFQKRISPQKEDNEEKAEEECEHRNNCSICLEKYEQDEKIKLMPCFHQFHSDCIDGWLGRKTWCPVCKFDVTQMEQSQVVPGLD